MSGKRARITERLQPVNRFSDSTGDELYLATSLAHMRLLAGMDSLMDSQGRTLDELLVTTRMITYMRSHTTVNTFCHEISFGP